MKEVCYYVAEDGKKFEDMYDCINYERQKMLEEVRDEFVFLDGCRKPIAIEDAKARDVEYIIIKTDRAAEIIGQIFDADGCYDPFDGVYEDCVGTWVYGILDKAYEWTKLELAIEQLQTLAWELNRGAE